MTSARTRPEAFDPLRVSLGGRHLIEASAGTGKTFTLAMLYVRLVLERGLPVRAILVVTFTRAATAELRERIRARLRQMHAALSGRDVARDRDPMLQELVEARLRQGELERDLTRLAQALASFDEAAISTIHGFCQRALDEHAFDTRTDPDTEFSKDDSQIFSDLASDFHANHLEQMSPRLYAAVGARARKPVPTYLEGMARVFARGGPLALLPQAQETDDLAPVERALERAHAAARAVYPGGQELVRLLTAGALKKNIYQRASWSGKWAPVLDALFDAEAPESLDGKAREALLKLTPEAIAGGTRKAESPPAHPLFDAVAALLQAWGELDEALEGAVVQLLLGFAEHVREELPRRKARAGRRSYSDLLVALHDALMAPDAGVLVEALRASFGAALVDEFQDTDPLQYAIFDKLFGDQSHPLFLIGDPKQAIYAFRGADIFAYLRAAEDARSQRHTLTTNWRSDPGLLRGVATLFDSPAPFLDPRIRFVDVDPRPGVQARLPGPALRLLWLRRDDPGVGGGAKITADFMHRQVPRLLARHVADLLEREPSLSPPDIAVLTRTNEAAAFVQAALSRQGVPAVLESAASVFDSVEAAEVELILRALLAPTDVGALRSALVTGLLGMGGRELLELSRDEARWDELAALFGELRRAWFERSVSALERALLERFSVSERLSSRPGGERSLMNTLHVFELLGDIASRERLSASSLLERFHALRVEPSRRSAELDDSAQLRLESDARAVRVTTIHKSKGLEYPIVYAPHVCELGVSKAKDYQGVRFHDPDAGDRETLDLGSDDFLAHRERAMDEAFAEGMRLFYVALTRAKHRAYVVWGAAHGFAESAPAWLLHGAQRAVAGESARAATLERVKPLEDDALEADLLRLVASSRGAIALDKLVQAGAPAATQLELQLEAPPTLVARAQLPEVHTAYRVASFSSLKSFGSQGDLLEGRDRDQGVAPEASAQEGEDAPRVILADFPSGTGPGHVVHEVFERYAFESPDTTPIEPLCRAALLQRGFDEALAPTLERGLSDALNTPLGESREPSLHDMDAHRAELEFFLRAEAQPRLTPRRLAAVFRRHGAPVADPSYAERLSQLAFPELSGYLHGFVDLIFRAGERYYVVDYKTNHLGDHAQDYAPSALLEPMAHHHYHLQYHLYVVAMVRMLRSRLPSFDYDTHFGGVRYLFVRGMSPDHAASTGVYVERPTESLVADLEQAIMGPSARTRGAS